MTLKARHLDDTTPVSAASRPVARGTRVALATLTGLLLGLWLYATPPGLLGKADAVGYAICHRIPERSLHTSLGAHHHAENERPLPLCARCTGIYLGVVTGVAVLARRGRLRAGHLPRFRWIAVLMVLGALYGLDGLNSYLTLFPGYKPLYTPHNTLRLVSGMSFGLTLTVLLVPTFNALAWAAPLKAAPIDGGRDLIALYAVAGAVAALVLADLPAIVLIAGLVSAAAVVMLFALLGSVLFLTLTRRECQARAWGDLVIPALAGFAFALLVLGGLDLARYVLTGTWAGFEL